MGTQDVLAQYLARADSYQAQARELEHQAHALLRQAEQLRTREEDFRVAAELLRPVLVEGEEDDLTGLVVDFTGCQSILDRLVRIGQAAPERLLNTTKTAQFLLANGQSRSDLKNYRTEVNRVLANKPEYFAKMSAGTYRYIGELLPVLDEAINGTQEGGPVVIPSLLETLGVPEGPNVGRYGPCEG